MYFLSIPKQKRHNDLVEIKDRTSKGDGETRSKDMSQSKSPAYAHDGHHFDNNARQNNNKLQIVLFQIRDITSYCGDVHCATIVGAGRVHSSRRVENQRLVCRAAGAGYIGADTYSTDRQNDINRQ